MHNDLDWWLEEFDFLEAVLSETEEDWIWEQAEKRFKDVWSVIHSRDPKHPTVIKGPPWLDPSWGPPAKTRKAPVPLPGSPRSGAQLTQPKTSPHNIDLWSGPWFNQKSDDDSDDLKLELDDEPKEKTEGDKLMDFFFK